MSSPNYGDNPEHYKKLISKINEGTNFHVYLYRKGYKLIKQSAGSMELQNDDDRIVLQTSRSPVTYFNRNDSSDKGLFFKFLLRRSANFYKAVQNGLEIANQSYEIENTDLKIEKPKQFIKSLEENYNIVPLRNSTYLRRERHISKETINSKLFKGRIFNAYHVRGNGGKIANIAFPKYDLENKPKNYILYNKPYRSKTDNEIKKFRLVLNQKDHFLFYSKPIENPERIIFGESGSDLLSYHELHGKPKNFYVSFGGNVYREKLQFFIQLIEPFIKSDRVELVSITDNDNTGYQFDLKVFTSVINRSNPNVYIETSIKRANVSLHIHYTEKVRNQISKHEAILNEKLTSDIYKIDLAFGLVKCVGLSDKLLLEFSLKKTINTDHIEQKKNILQTLIGTINGIYLSFNTSIHKSQEKDWNDDLRASKSTKYQKMEQVIQGDMVVGDKIELKTFKGPEGATNEGVIKSIHENGVECDFGLRYTYAIPYSAIASHFKKVSVQHIKKESAPLKKNSKISNLQNHTL